MNKTIVRIIIPIVTLLCILFATYFFNNYNTFIIYDFQGSDEHFSINGNATFSKKYQIININNINYRNISDVMIQKIRISLFAKIDGKERLIYASEDKSDESFSLVEYLKTFSYVLKEPYGYNDCCNNQIIKNFSDIIYVRIEVVDSNGISMETVIKLNSQKYSNNQFFYKKVPSLG